MEMIFFLCQKQVNSYLYHYHAGGVAHRWKFTDILQELQYEQQTKIQQLFAGTADLG